MSVEGKREGEVLIPRLIYRVVGIRPALRYVLVGPPTGSNQLTRTVDAGSGLR